MAKQKAKVEVKEKPVEVVEPIKETPVAKSTVPTLKKAIITDRDTLLKLQSESRLVNFDPKTGEATYKEE
jgi:hypothetical protein